MRFLFSLFVLQGNLELLAIELDHVSHHELSSTPCFQFPVDQDLAPLDKQLGLATCLHQLADLEELVQSNCFLGRKLAVHIGARAGLLSFKFHDQRIVVTHIPFGNRDLVKEVTVVLVAFPPDHQVMPAAN